MVISMDYFCRIRSAVFAGVWIAKYMHTTRDVGCQWTSLEAVANSSTVLC